LARGGYTRRQLKEDRFADAAAETLHWTVEHRNSLIVGGTSALLVLGLLLGWWFYRQHQETQASIALGHGVRIRHAAVLPPGGEPHEGHLEFRSSGERAQAARDQFRKVAAEHSGTRSGELARYFMGVMAMEMGDTEEAQAIFEEVAAWKDQDLASLARMGLASVYRMTARHSLALDVYRALAESPTATVPRATALLEQAATYEALQQTAEARRLYEQVRIDEPAGFAAQVAASRLAGLQQ
jgi:tetratricopeptide (TPR) repeat protein